MSKAADRGKPSVGQIIAPTTTPPPSIDVAAKEAKRRAELTPTDRIEARADSLITELRADKLRLDAELHALRYTEISHLRDDLRWLEARESSLLNALTALRTSYEWASSFNWFSFALTAVGGCVVSYAAFLPVPRSPDNIGAQKIVATFGFALLSIGVIVQAFVSYRGTKTLTGLARVDDPPQRPSPNPKPSEALPTR
jgi:hypothetical protein